MNASIVVALLLPILGAAKPSDEFSYIRRYVEGESYQYEICERNEGSTREQKAVSRHTIMLRDGAPYERVQWVSLSDSEEGDLSALAARVEAAELSLRPGGQFNFSKPFDNPRMMGAVTDLITFFTAVSPQMGVANVTRPGAQYIRPELVVGDFADGKEFLAGRSCTRLTITLSALDKETATYESLFAPPDSGCPALTHEWMKARVCNRENTFEMVRKQGPGFVVAWGCEEMKVVSRVARKTGAILSAEMDNRLTWKMRFCMDEALTQCRELPDVSKHRLVTLRLVK